MMTGIGFMGFAGVFMMILFWGGLIALIVLLVRGVVGNSQPSSQPPTGTGMTPREILDQRYARGEVSREEYDQMKRDLQA